MNDQNDPNFQDQYSQDTMKQMQKGSFTAPPGAGAPGPMTAGAEYEQAPAASKSPALRRLIIGIVMIGGGVAVTVMSMGDSSSDGRIFFGLIIWGGIEVLRGLYGLAKSG